MKFILGTKQNMTQVFDESGQVTPVTVINAGPITVTDLRTKERDKYEAVQVGFGERKLKNISKAVQGQIKDILPKEGFGFSHQQEFRQLNGLPENLKIGDKIDVSIFVEGEAVTVSGISKAKGFQGGVKRHGFHGGSRTHGQKHSEREPGSIGATGPQRVLKGTRMAGRMGGERITVKNLRVVKIDKDNNQLYISGAVPGRRGTLVEIVAN
jgi:large subunit ribosomal protein L3